MRIVQLEEIVTEWMTIAQLGMLPQLIDVDQSLIWAGQHAASFCVGEDEKDPLELVVQEQVPRRDCV